MQKIALVTVGDELLNGQTTDTNSVWLGSRLNDLGCKIYGRFSVGDIHDDIIDALDFAFANANIVIMTGGLGPTKDDITKKALATYFNDTFVFDQGTYDRIVPYSEQTGRKPTEAHRLQCFMPSKADLILNERGTAPGMWIEDDGRVLLSVPGVPTEMKGIFENRAFDRIAARTPDFHILHHVIQTAGLGETYIAERIESITNNFPDHISIAYLPGMASVKLRLTAQGRDKIELQGQLQEIGASITNILGDAVYAIGKESIEKHVGKLALEKGLTFGSAESCTGGHISHMVTAVPGSSAYYKGSVIAYDNQVKEHVLNVQKDTLLKYGAVSEATVKEMVKGGLDRIGTDLMIAVSGIAGPSGGSEEKPVGTIWVAVGNRDEVRTKKLRLSKNRILNIKYASMLALNELRLFMKMM